MTRLISSATMSLDGFIAHADDTIDPLFEWYSAGEVELEHAGDLPPSHLTPDSAAYWSRNIEATGSLLVGRRLFDVTNGWEGRHPLGVPVVVLTHEAPTDWAPTYGAEQTTFVTDGVEAAVEAARRLAAGKDVGVAAGTVASQVLQAGLLDEVDIDLAPVFLGSGKPYFTADVDADRLVLADPIEVVPSLRVTHLRYPVRRDVG